MTLFPPGFSRACPQLFKPTHCDEASDSARTQHDYHQVLLHSVVARALPTSLHKLTSTSSLIMTTFQAKDMHLQVHVGPYPKVPIGPEGKVKSDASQSASYAQSIKPASIFEVFTDGSVCGDTAGYAAAWREPLPAHPNHYAHQSGQLQRAGIASSEAELRSINLGLDSAHNWRDRALHRSVIVYSDNAVNLKLVRDWQEGVTGDRPLDPHVEHVLVRMKYWAALLHQQGVEVTLRWMKSRRDIDGHDIADIWSKVRSGARPGGKRWLWQRDSDLRWHIYQWRREENANPALRLALAQFKEEVVNAPPQ